MSRIESVSTYNHLPSTSTTKESPSPGDKGEVLSSLTDFTIPTNKKIRIVRVRRNSLGVEIGRSYADSTMEKENDINDEDKSQNIERLPLSPLKPSLITMRRSSLDTSTVQSDVDRKVLSPSPSLVKKKIVRVRRNSLGVEIDRTYTDVTSNDEFSNSQCSANSDRILPTSPTKTRFVRVQRNSLGVEIGRTYVNPPQAADKEKQEITVVNPSNDKIQNDTMTSMQLSPVPSFGLSKSSLSSPGKISSPNKVASQRMKSLSRNVHMKAMEKSLSDLNKLDLLSSEAETEVEKGSNEQLGIRKKSARNIMAVGGSTTSNDVPPVSPATIRKIKSLKAQSSPKVSIDGSDNHFVTSPSPRSRSMRMYPSTDNKSNTDDHQVQSLRLLRVLLGEDAAAMTKQNVDNALEKHAELLRFQLQQKKKIKQKDEMIQQEKRQQEKMTEEHTEQMEKLTDDVEKQKLLMKTSLEIKDVEIGILTKEIQQKTVKLQQFGWRLAKERALAKESKSFDPKVADSSSTEVVIALDSQSSDNKDDSNSLLDLMNLPGQAEVLDDDDLSEATPLVGHISSSNINPPEKFNLYPSKEKESDESSNVMTTTQLETKLDQAEGQLLIAKKSILVLEKQKQEMELDFEETLCESKSKVAQLKAVLTACNGRRQVAEQMLRDLGKYDEATLVKISRKPSNELMSDISERGISMKVGAVTTSESDISPAPTKVHISLQKNVQSLKDQLEESHTRSRQLEADSEANIQLVEATIEANAKLESQLADLQIQQKACEAQLVAAKSRSAEKLKATATSLREIEKVTAEYNAVNQANSTKMAAELQSLQSELHETQLKNTELENVAANSIQDFADRSTVVDARLHEATCVKERAERDMQHHKLELDEARLLLQQSESMIKKYSSRLQEANVEIKQLEEKVATLTEQIATKTTIGGSTSADISIASVEEIHLMLRETQLQAKEYETKLHQVQLALHESETMAEKYLSMLEEANTTLEQSEKLMKQYDKLQPNLIQNESTVDDSDVSSVATSESESSDDLSMKSTQDLLAIASKRLYGTAHNNDTSNAADDDNITNGASNVKDKKRHDFYFKAKVGSYHEPSEASSIASTHADDETMNGTLMHEWEKSQLQNTSLSKIAQLETELAERQIQLNDALQKIADLTRSRDASSSTIMAIHNGDVDLAKAIAQVIELKERVAIAEERYNETAKKLLFLKETILTVVDTEISITK